MRPSWRSIRYTLCGRRSHSSPASGDGHRRLKNCPGLTASALGEACTMRCLYSEFTQSWETTGQSASSAGMWGSAAEGTLLPTTKGAQANMSCVEGMGELSEPGCG